MKFKLLPFDEAKEKFIKTLLIYYPQYVMAERKQNPNSIIGIDRESWEDNKIFNNAKVVGYFCKDVLLLTGEDDLFRYPACCCEVIEE